MPEPSRFDAPGEPAPATAASRLGEHFLHGGGETGERMRALDWCATPLGPPAGWPQSLKTIVRVMLDSRYAMWMLWGPEMTFFCNDAYLPTVGIKRDWVLGARSDRVWQEIWPDIGPRIEHVLQHGEATWDEGLLLFLERSGFAEETYHTFSYSPVYDDDRVAGMLCVVTEVTERVIGERRLRMLRDLAATVARTESAEQSCRRSCEVLAAYPLDTPIAALYLTNADARSARRVAQTRALDERYFPATLSLGAGDTPWPVANLLASETAQRVQRLPERGIEIASSPWPDLVQEALVLPLQGSGHGLAGFLIVACSPRRPLDDRYLGFLDLLAGQVGAAVAESQAYEAERRRAHALAELDRAKTAFFSNVSHEFRTPLTLMLGPLEDAITDASVPAPVRERLELAQRSAARLHRLVNSLLDFSRIEAGRVRASFEPTDLAALTRDLASTFRSAMQKAGLDYVVDCETGAVPVHVDREMWEKIVLNLLSNAFKFTLSGSVQVRIRHHDGHALLEVADTGVGIPDAELTRLFERFHRVESTQGRTHEGSGIGLALVQELVKLHGATIEVTSRFGAGTVFRVRVPLGTAHLPAEHIRPARPLAGGLAGARTFVDEALRWLPDAPADSDAMRADLPSGMVLDGDLRFASTFGARLILADDNADMRAYVRELLAPYYAVEAVADGQQALDAARRSRPDLILSDVMMPNLDGFGLLAAVRSDPTLRGVPVVLLSARAGEEARIEGLDAGADDYLVKPFTARELLTRIGALLELQRMRQSVEEGFRLRTAQFETLLEQAPLGVYLVDAELYVREANPIARAAFSEPHVVGRSLEELMHAVWPPEHARDIVDRFRHTLVTGEPYLVAEHAGKRVDRDVTEYREWQIHRMPLPDGRHGAVCYFRDISAQVRAREQLQRADRQKDEFLAMLAHELRNPLAPIRNAGEILSRVCTDSPQAQQVVGIVMRQVGTLTRLVDDLLDISRITQGRIDLQRRPVQMADLVGQAVETVESLVREKGQSLSVTTYRGLEVNGDPERLVQCIANILTNAAKYTSAGGRIHVEAQADGDEAVVRVTDNGIGIPSELQPRVFDLFAQGDQSLDRSQGGLGIGLSVVKRLVDMHGGRVSVASEGVGKGSTFEIRLPLAQAQPLRAAQPAPPRPTPRRILVVDDNADAAVSLALILRLDGHEVEAVHSGEAALEHCLACRPDVALIDIGLPGIDGYEVARRFREHPALAHMHLFALTGYGQEEHKARARSAGFDDHLVKPADVGVLNALLAAAHPRHP